MTPDAPVRRRKPACTNHVIAVAALFASPLIAQPAPRADQAMARARRMTEAVPPCPTRNRVAESILVCARNREDPFRIPGVIRAEPQERKAGAATAWGIRSADAEEAARSGRINGSSPDGSGGQSGHTQKIRREWERERQAIAARKTDGTER